MVPTASEYSPVSSQSSIVQTFIVPERKSDGEKVRDAGADRAHPATRRCRSRTRRDTRGCRSRTPRDTEVSIAHPARHTRVSIAHPPLHTTITWSDLAAHRRHQLAATTLLAPSPYGCSVHVFSEFYIRFPRGTLFLVALTTRVSVVVESALCVYYTLRRDLCGRRRSRAMR